MGWNAYVGIPLAIFGAIALAAIYFFGRPRRPDQGKRMPPREPRISGERIEPTWADPDAPQPEQGELDVGLDEELQRLGSEIAGENDRIVATETAVPAPKASSAGVRPPQPIDRIVTLFVAARPGTTLPGASLIVAAEKTGLTFGDMGIFHRLVSGKPEAGPVFSMANMVKPGNFDMRHVDEMQITGVSFFMTLPGPLPALDAWDAMLPTAQRLAELLDASVLDEERNALGRQRIAHIREELRAYDRKQERNQIRLR
ncbi:MAG TPA: cell division protein ZipA [Rudaea sp.]